MLFFEWRMLRRRWYAVLLGLALTGGLAVLAAMVVPVTYSAQAQLLLLPPKAAVEPTQNPYLSLGGLTGVSDALARSMTDASTQETLAGLGATASFTIEPDPVSPGPVIDVSTADRDPEAVLASLKVVVQQTLVHLQSLQTSQGVARKSLITGTILSSDTSATPVSKTQVRAILVAVAAGLAITWLGTALLDALLRWRRRRPENAEAGGPEPVSQNGAAAGGEVADFSRLIRSSSPTERLPAQAGSADWRFPTTAEQAGPFASPDPSTSAHGAGSPSE